MEYNQEDNNNNNLSEIIYPSFNASPENPTYPHLQPKVNKSNNVSFSLGNEGYEPVSQKVPEENLTEEKYKYVSEKAKYVFLLIIIGIAISIIIVLLGFLVASKTKVGVSYVLITVGISSALIFAFGMFAVKKYEKRVDKYLTNINHEDPELIDQSTSRNMINIAIYLFMVTFIVYFILSIGCLGFQDSIKDEIRALSSDQQKWNQYFGNATYEDTISSITAILFTTGGFGILLCIFVGTLLYFSFKVLGIYRAWQTVVEFVCLLFLILGFVFLYLSVYTTKYQYVANVDQAMPGWVPIALLITAIFGILTAIFGYISAQQENPKYLKIFSLIIGIFTACILVFSIGSAIYASRFSEYFATRCTSILDYMNQDYLINSAGCERKYVFVQSSLDNFQCPKERIVSAWEVNLGVETEKQKEAYGCVDAGCCISAYGYIKTTIDYLTLVSACLFFIGSLMVIGTCYMLNKLENNEEKVTQYPISKKAVLLIAGITGILILLLIFLIPTPPTPSPLTFTEVDKANKNNAIVDSNTILTLNSTDFTIRENNHIESEARQNTSIYQNTTGCEPNCLIVNYYYELSSDNGIFVANQELINKANVSVVISQYYNKKMIVGFNGTDQNLDNFVNLFTFVRNCPLIPATVHVRVIATASDRNSIDNKSFIQFSKKENNFNFIQLKNKLKQENTANKPNQIRTVNNNNKDSTKNDTNNNNSSYNNESNNSINNNFVATVDVSKMKNGQSIKVLEKDLDYSFIDLNSPQILTGRILRLSDNNITTPAANANIKLIPVDFSQCPALQYLTDNNGRFRTGNLYHLINEIPTTYKVEIRGSDLVTYTTKVTIGGINQGKYIDIGSLSIWSKGFFKNANITSIIFDAVNNKPLVGAIVSIHQGFVNFENSRTSSNGKIVNNDISTGQSTSFLQIKQNLEKRVSNSNKSNNTISNNGNNDTYLNNSQNKTAANTNSNFLVKNTTTDDNGVFNFYELPPKTYTIVVNKDGYYREVYYIDVIGDFTKPLNTLPMSPYLQEGQLRFILTWPNGPKDLDMHTMFKINKYSNCEVFFGKQSCAGTSLNINNYNGSKKGVEAVTIDTLGKYYYTFMVHKYDDVSKGQASGDNFAKGSDLQAVISANNSDNSTIPNKSLIYSQAKISVYAYGFVSAIYQLNIASTISNTTVIDPTQFKANENIDNYNYWLAFCLNGNTGIDSLSVINKVSTKKPNMEICERLYTNNSTSTDNSFIQLKSKNKIKRIQ